MQSNKAKYALKAAIARLPEFGQGLVLISDIAQTGRIRRKFLELTLLELRHGGILQNRNGKGGGYLLAREPGSGSLGEILRVVEGSLAPIPSVSKTAYMRCRECRDENSCGNHIVMKKVRDATTVIFDSATSACVLGASSSASAAKEGFADTPTKTFWRTNRFKQ
jgi:Rrf2 family protein